jgi:2-oxoglutarate dehydrogenase E2 component (dihydrolipoamide succinyltransferase)
MATDVVMPQMGESIAEGTIVRWIKNVGDRVDRDEPLFEISTDKVDAEIPSPAAGVVTEIRAQAGDTVPVNSIVAVIGEAGEVAARKPAGPPAEAAEPEKPSPQGNGANRVAATEQASRAPAIPAPMPKASPPPKPLAPDAAPARPAPAAPSVEEALRQRSSPLVRKIAQEHHVDISRIPGTGIAGRVTKHDILSYLEGAQRAEPAAAAAPPRAGGERATPAAERPAPERPTFAPGEAAQVVPMSVMRRKIAEHMVLSKRTSAHVHSVFEVNFGRVAQIREAKKAEYERAGAKLTYLSFIIKASVDALRAMPIVNASVDGEKIVYHKEINVGVAVALDWGLIVPVIKNADERNLLGLSRAVADLASRARAKQLKPDEVAGGTFTITNPGVFGALFGMPIINQPQVAILGVGNVEKRPVVIDDAIAIRPMAYLSLGYDHRLIDGAVADQFMSHVKRALEGWDPAQA